MDKIDPQFYRDENWGGVNLENGVWYIPDHGGDFLPAKLLQK